MAWRKPKHSMEILDVIHGHILIYPWERNVIDSRFFQRLRNIKQLGFAELAYPCATHNRYTHSIGAMYLAGRAFENIFEPEDFSAPEVYETYYNAARLAALLHDVGHGPLSHASEFAMPKRSELKLPPELPVEKDEQASHEDYTMKILLDSSMTKVLEDSLKPFGLQPWHIASLIMPELADKDTLFVDKGTNFRKILHQLISSEIDVDRMDYLQRDSYYTGTSYGKYDFGWLIANLGSHVTEVDKKVNNGADKLAHLSVSDRAIYTFEDFLLSRYHMFLQVYFHQKSLIYEEMLKRYLRSPECQYAIPADIERYIEFDDSHLYMVMRESGNEWATRVAQRNPYRVSLEVHDEQNSWQEVYNTESVKKFIAHLENKGIPWIKSSSEGALSKYFRLQSFNRKPKVPAEDPTIYVAVSDRLHPVNFVELEKFTDLFKRYGETKRIVRIYTPERVKVTL